MTFAIIQNQPGPLPLKVTFTSPITGDVTIAFSGSCWSSTAQNPGGVEVLLDVAHVVGRELGHRATDLAFEARRSGLCDEFGSVADLLVVDGVRHVVPLSW